jgi:hypothetical protein
MDRTLLDVGERSTSATGTGTSSSRISGTAGCLPAMNCSSTPSALSRPIEPVPQPALGSWRILTPGQLLAAAEVARIAPVAVTSPSRRHSGLSAPPSRKICLLPPHQRINYHPERVAQIMATKVGTNTVSSTLPQGQPCRRPPSAGTARAADATPLGSGDSRRGDVPRRGVRALAVRVSVGSLCRH